MNSWALGDSDFIVMSELIRGATYVGYHFLCGFFKNTTEILKTNLSKKWNRLFNIFSSEKFNSIKHSICIILNTNLHP